MRFALINPPWDFAGSIYFGCREPHLPLEYGYSRALLERAGHEVAIIDAQFDGLTREEIRRRIEWFAPDFTVVTTAPSYLFWRCAPPELRVPQEVVRDVYEAGGTLIAVGPHASTTPRATLRKLDVDVVVLGECEEVLPRLADTPRSRWDSLSSICYRDSDGHVRVQGEPHAADIGALPPLHWPDDTIGRHRHHHHRFDSDPAEPGAEMETTRGCPYHCSFCAKDNFRNKYRKRPLAAVLDEFDRFRAQGVEYVYFIDEIFLPNKELLESLVKRNTMFGVQTRIDLWSFDMLDLLGDAGCVSMEVGVESITPQGRDLLDKNCKLSTADLSARLIYAKKKVPFVQANLIDAGTDDPEEIDVWRNHLKDHGVWANKPVPLFPYPGSPDYTKLWGLPDDGAWERAHEHYLRQNSEFSDIQDDRPRSIRELELPLVSPE